MGENFKGHYVEIKNPNVGNCNINEFTIQTQKKIFKQLIKQFVNNNGHPDNV